MLDCHIHIQGGEYSPEWLGRFVETAIERKIDEIWLLEHSYRFSEFMPMYNSVYFAFNDEKKAWFNRKAGVLRFDDHLRFINNMRKRTWPVKIKFGVEVCYFKRSEDFIYNMTNNKELDFLAGSVHFIGDFAFDHKPEDWNGIDVDSAYRVFFETSVDLATSGIYNGLTHPDSIKLFGHKPSFSLNDHYDRLAAVLAKNGMYAEQSSGCRRRCPDTAELGMNKGLIKAMKNHGVKIQTASDAHRPEDVGSYIKELEELL